MAYSKPIYNFTQAGPKDEISGINKNGYLIPSNGLSGPNWTRGSENNNFGKKFFNLDLCNKYNSSSDLKQFHTVTFYFRNTAGKKDPVFIRAQLPDKVSYAIGGVWQAPVTVGGGKGLVSAILSATGTSSSTAIDNTKIWSSPKPLAIKLSLPVFDDVEDESNINFQEALEVFGRATLPEISDASLYSTTPGPAYFMALANRQDGKNIKGAGTADYLTKLVGREVNKTKIGQSILGNAEKDLDRITIQIGGMLLIDWAIITDFSVTYPNTKNQILHKWNGVRKTQLLPQLAQLDVQIETVTGMTQTAYKNMLNLTNIETINDVKENTATTGTDGVISVKNAYEIPEDSTMVESNGTNTAVYKTSNGKTYMGPIRTSGIPLNTEMRAA